VEDRARPTLSEQAHRLSDERLGNLVSSFLRDVEISDLAAHPREAAVAGDLGIHEADDLAALLGDERDQVRVRGSDPVVRLQVVQAGFRDADLVLRISGRLPGDAFLGQLTKHGCLGEPQPANGGHLSPSVVGTRSPTTGRSTGSLPSTRHGLTVARDW
jgi:hypothetical protein